MWGREGGRGAAAVFVSRRPSVQGRRGPPVAAGMWPHIAGRKASSPPASLLQPLWLLDQGSGHLSDEGGQPPVGTPRGRAVRGQPGLHSAFCAPSGPPCTPTFPCPLPPWGLRPRGPCVSSLWDPVNGCWWNGPLVACHSRGSPPLVENRQVTSHRRPGKWSRQEEKEEQSRETAESMRGTRAAGISGNKTRGQEKMKLGKEELARPRVGRKCHAGDLAHSRNRETSPQVTNGLWSVSVIHAVCWSLNNVPCDMSSLAYAASFKECCYLLSDHKT